MTEGQILTELLKSENTELANQIIVLIKRKNNKITALTRENLELREINWNYQQAEVAQQAIEDVIEPFMKEHPDFKW